VTVVYGLSTGTVVFVWCQSPVQLNFFRQTTNDKRHMKET
jgi:hypothetical protein